MQGREQSRGPTGLLAYGLSFAACALVVAVAAGFVGVLTPVGLAGLVTTAVVMPITMSIVLAICVVWWRRLDEAAREAHKWAWWWGGTVGTAMAGVFLVMVTTFKDGEAVLPIAPPADLIFLGGVGVLFCQAVGYGVAWAAWWLQRR